jgi:membrane protein DedA with SNARE-associated domain
MKRYFVAFLFVLMVFHVMATQNEKMPSDKNENWVVRIENWYENNMNYATITALMTIESSFIPLPSEIVIPPAAYIACKPDSKLNIYLVIFFGTLGALFGALLNYGLACWLGRPLLYKLADGPVGKLFLLTSEKVKHSEDYFNKNGKISTFIGRLLPGVRHLISIPAGLSRMNMGAFITYTVAGAFIWNVVLALMGYLAQGQSELILKYSHEFSLIIVGLLVFGIVYLVFKVFTRKKTIE